MDRRSGSGEPQDRVLVFSRVLSAVIVPSLIAAFIILFLFPRDTPGRFSHR